MAKRAILMICLAVAALGTVEKGFSQEKFTVDKVIANVGNSVILYSEVVEAEQQLIDFYRQNRYTPPSNSFYEAFEQLLETKLCYNQALIDSVQVNTGGIASQVDEYIRARTDEAGTVRALEALTGMSIYELRANLKKQLEERAHAESMQDEVKYKVKITPGEVDAFYKSFPSDSIPIIPDQYMYAQITRFPSTMTDARQRVRETLLQYREDLINGTQKFEILARLYSQDPATSSRGGEMEPFVKQHVAEPFGNAVAKLKPGQVSEVVETEDGFHIIELIEKLPGDRYRVRHILRRPEFMRDEMTEALNFLDSLATQIRADSITFELAARIHSDDKATRMNGGVVTNAERLMKEHGSVPASYTSFRFMREDFGNDIDDYRRLVEMQPGDVSDAYESRDVRGNRLCKIIKLVEFFPTHEANLQDDYLVLEAAALRMKTDREYQKWLDKTIQSTFIRIDPAYRAGLNPKWVKK